jgi:hypothetical protein
MNFAKYKTTITPFDAKFKFVQTLLIHFMSVNTFLLFQHWITEIGEIEKQKKISGILTSARQ